MGCLSLSMAGAGQEWRRGGKGGSLPPIPNPPFPLKRLSNILLGACGTNFSNCSCGCPVGLQHVTHVGSGAQSETCCKKLGPLPPDHRTAALVVEWFHLIVASIWISLCRSCVPLARQARRVITHVCRGSLHMAPLPVTLGTPASVLRQRQARTCSNGL